MKRYAVLSLFAFAVLAFASVWLGGLNQDEGWYLYAARLVSFGQIPYRDFFFTQGPIMPYIYAAFHGLWSDGGILGARIFTLTLGFFAILFASATAAVVAKEGERKRAALICFILLACNLYHLYYSAIPKTYALASLFATSGFFLFASAYRKSSKLRFFAAGLALSFAAGVRSSLVLLPVAAFTTLFIKAFLSRNSEEKISFSNVFIFGFAAFFAALAVFGPFLLDGKAFEGLLQAQKYHVLRQGGGDLMMIIGSLSRLVRWYVPVFVLLGLGLANGGSLKSYGLTLWAMGLGFIFVFVSQLLAPCPYEDYQVPIMLLLAVIAAVLAAGNKKSLLLALGMTWAVSFGSRLLEKCTTDGQDRFWTIKKEKAELAVLRDVAREIEELDPQGKTLLTQDLYLAVECKRQVPKDLEMGPFSDLTPNEWRELLGTNTCDIAACSGYTFAINPPSCVERDIKEQIEFWEILKKRYKLVSRKDRFGQNSTPLLILKRMPEKDGVKK
jgi:branched-subunit amino acid transport protein